jgi:hypothetical protein
MVSASQQMPDRSFRPMIEDRAYAIGTGPVVCFDQGRRNQHTLEDGFAPFADLVRRDGYIVRAIASALDAPSLAACRLLVIVAPRVVVPAAAVRPWVAAGGGLLVVADRESMPWAADLVAAFGVALVDAPAIPTQFRAGDKTLRPHAIARGRHAKESVARVTTFTGQALRLPQDAEMVLVAADGGVQGGVMRVGLGRAAFFGDPVLFTAQIAGPKRRVLGMSARGAEQNFQFVLNVMHWLSGVI